MLRVSDILNIMEFKKGLDSIPVHKVELTREERDKKIANMLGYESFPDPVTGETLYRPKDGG
jgi:hypothetical protein